MLSSVAILTGIGVIAKLFSEVFYIVVDFGISYYLIPFLILIGILIIIKRIVYIKTIWESKDNWDSKDEFLLEAKCDKINSWQFLGVLMVICLFVALLIAGISNQSIQFPFNELLSKNFFEQQQTIKISQLPRKSVIQSDIDYIDGNGQKIQVICDIALNCSKSFVDNWYKDNQNNFKMLSNTDDHDYQKITYPNAIGEWIRRPDENLIVLHLRTKNDYVYLQIRWDSTIDIDFYFSEETLINYSYLLINQ